jgi:DNA-directed RNA polymerase specialized sigma24 family protein
MEHAGVSLWTEQSSDAELIAGVRSGESVAFGVLFERHGSAARRVAGMYSAVASDVDDIVAEAFARVLKALQQGDGPDMAFRAYLFTVVPTRT